MVQILVRMPSTSTNAMPYNVSMSYLGRTFSRLRRLSISIASKFTLMNTQHYRSWHKRSYIIYNCLQTSHEKQSAMSYTVRKHSIDLTNARRSSVDAIKRRI